MILLSEAGHLAMYCAIASLALLSDAASAWIAFGVQLKFVDLLCITLSLLLPVALLNLSLMVQYIYDLTIL